MGDDQGGQPRGYSVLLYPFHHGLAPGSPTNAARLDEVAARWRPWYSRLDATVPEPPPPTEPGAPARREVSDLTKAIDDSYFFTPGTRGLLFGDLVDIENQTPAVVDTPADLAEAIRARAAERDRRLVDLRGPHARVATARDGNDRPSHAMRLTLREESLEQLRGLEMAGRPFGTEVACVDLWLFPEGVGVVAFEVRHPEGVTHDELMELSWYMRNVWAPKADMDDSPITLDGRAIGWRPVLEWLLSGLVHREIAAQPRALAEVTDLRYTASAVAQAIGVTMHMVHLVYATDDADLVQTGAELISCWRWDEPDWRPSDATIEALRTGRSVHYWDGWAAVAWWEVVAVVARPTRFTTGALPGNWRFDYTPLLTLSLFQRVALLRFQDRLDGHAATLLENAAGSRALARDVLRFRNELMFQAPTSRDLGMALHRRFQDLYRIDELASAVHEEATELAGAFAGDIGSRLERGLTFLTVVGLPLGALLTIFSSNLGALDIVAITVLTALLSAMLWAGYRALLHRRER